jgi:hypothetical protein
MRRTDRSSWFCRCVCVWRGRVSKCTIPALSTQPFIHVVGQVGRLWESPLDTRSVRERCVASRSANRFRGRCVSFAACVSTFSAITRTRRDVIPRHTHTHRPVIILRSLISAPPRVRERALSKIYRSPLGGTLFDTR